MRLGVHCLTSYSFSFYAGEDAGGQDFSYLIDGSVNSITLILELSGHLKFLFLFFEYS